MEGYDCPCKAGMKGDGKAGTCTDKFPIAAKVTVGSIGRILLLSFLLFGFVLYKEKRKTREFFRKNGGPTLDKAKIIKLYKKEDLKPILKPSNLIGKGFFGEVYKGHVDIYYVLENEQFANEVSIQPQVIHRNIVRLIGCCLEVDTPMLVYEFISKGSLDDIPHKTDIRQPITRGLSYMHYEARTKILHGDVKPANILLDENFGTSRLIAKDKQPIEGVIGDIRGYMDPVYMEENRLTEKSDVYSFGVVILELISRKKATHTDRNSLVKSFVDLHKGKKATDLFDKEIAVPGDMERLDSLAEMAVECLNLDVDKRPSMINKNNLKL
ncbi:hypothetical protein BRADI_5g03168v3 [Brachypodium distachyon]|uniref:Protein kinase domain-containing protein n=1 Tax=Brachypodium distachyon TaxID=15368 RepID=A0A0Q3E268_BRADI|nr:hypothetical protein BRADI_5g03168v3 [Brachypodium distachyon]